MLTDQFRKKKILITGNTGFKGTWLSLWLERLGATVFGASANIVSDPNHFEAASAADIVDTRFIDICDPDPISALITETKPDYIFHLAAQPIVRESLVDPRRTFLTNAMGTINVLESLRTLNNSCVAVMITSDKCYENTETYYGYKETDQLGGKDPYSASKAAAEIAISAYVRSFFAADGPVRIATARAGNVIGGGDWAPDRLVCDLVRGWHRKEKVAVRSPGATRPWQHVLEPLGGYLRLAEALTHNADLHGESFNFGPNQDVVRTVKELCDQMTAQLAGLEVVIEDDPSSKTEAHLLKLNCDKALSLLNWRAVMSFDQTVATTGAWYRSFYGKQPIAKVSHTQIERYEEQLIKEG